MIFKSQCLPLPTVFAATNMLNTVFTTALFFHLVSADGGLGHLCPNGVTFIPYGISAHVNGRSGRRPHLGLDHGSEL